MKFFKIYYFICFLLLTISVKAEINHSHAIAMHGSPKYSSDFKHVDYVNPNALKGGKVTFSSTGSYDSFNRFILKGSADGGSVSFRKP